MNKSLSEMVRGKTEAAVNQANSKKYGERIANVVLTAAFAFIVIFSVWS